MRNRIHDLRTKRNLTQKKLAEAAGTSQQQIQRIESGVQSARFDVAARICVALDSPMEMVFPATKIALRKSQKKGNTVEDLLRDDQIAEELGGAGIDMEVRVWTMKFLLRNGFTGFHQISGKECKRLQLAVQRAEGFDRFVVYDTNAERVALNLNHLIYAQFLFDPPGQKEETIDSQMLRIHTTILKEPLEFGVDPDLTDLSDEPDADDEDAQLQHLFFMLELSVEDDDIANFTDEDGEPVFLRLGDTAMIAASLPAVEPKLFKSEMEGYEEEDGTETGREDRTPIR